jgi:signal peptidase II
MSPASTRLCAYASDRNVLDRVVRGYVVDFVQVPHWPIFNVADIYVTAGAILLAWTAVSVRPQAGERSQSA